MINFFNLDKNESELNFDVPAASLVVFRVAVKSRLVAPSIIQPVMDDWITQAGAIVKTTFNISPSYQYLTTGAETRITITFHIPGDVKTGEKLYGGLRFPGVESQPIKIYLSIIEAVSVEQQISEFDIAIGLPVKKYEEDKDATDTLFNSKHSLKLLGALAGLEILPAKWLVSELIVTCCERGLQFSKSEEGAPLLLKLRKTKFYKNGVLVFRGAQISHWVLMGITISGGLNAVVNSKSKEPRMLLTWEEWLLTLIDKDIEAPDFQSIDVQFPQEHLFEQVTKELGTEAERWFELFVLGIATISPRMNAIIRQVCDKVKDPVPKTEPKAKKKIKAVLKEKGSLQR